MNQNSTVNTPANPAAIGSVIQIYCVGGGQSTPAGETGRLAAVPLKKPARPVSVTIGGLVARVEYYGDAPTLVEGLLQVNATIPPGVTPGNNAPVVLGIGDKQSPNWVTVAVAP